MTKSKPRLFISYSALDGDLAVEICAYLEAKGLACWIAPRDMELGNPFAQTIIEKIESSYALVLILSRTSNESDFVFHEVGNAVELKVPVLEFRIHPLQLHKRLKLYLRTQHHLDATKGKPQDHFRALYTQCAGRHEAATTALSGEAETSAAGVPTGTARTGRRWYVVSGSGVVILAGIVYQLNMAPRDHTPKHDETVHQPTQPVKKNSAGNLTVVHQDTPVIRHRSAVPPDVGAAAVSAMMRSLDGAVFINGASQGLSDDVNKISLFGIDGNVIHFNLNSGIYRINGKMKLHGNELAIISAEPACTGVMSLLNNGTGLTGSFQVASSANGKSIRLVREQP